MYSINFSNLSLTFSTFSPKIGWLTLLSRFFWIELIMDSFFDSSIINSLQLMMSTNLQSSMDLWVDTSKNLIESISSSNNSILTGNLLCTGKISTIPPLMANCPFDSIVSTLSYFNTFNFSWSSSKFIKSVSLIVNAYFFATDFFVIFFVKASNVVTMMNFSLFNNLNNTFTLWSSALSSSDLALYKLSSLLGKNSQILSSISFKYSVKFLALILSSTTTTRGLSMFLDVAYTKLAKASLMTPWM